MALQSSSLEYDPAFERLLEVRGGVLKRFRFRKCVREAKAFYAAYVKKCNEYNNYIDFFTPLVGYLVSCGFGCELSSAYVSEIREGVLRYFGVTLPVAGGGGG